MQLIHLSHEPILELKDVNIFRQEPFFKPKGLWFADVLTDESWAQWCLDNDFDGEWKYEYLLSFTKDANILNINTTEQLHSFHRDYCSEEYKVHWGVVASLFDGIVISPYQWSCRHSLSWYNSWDIAAACIWNTRKAIKLSLVSNCATASRQSLYFEGN